MGLNSDETSCKYCKHKNTYKQVTKNEYGESEWECKKSGCSSVTVYPGESLEKVLNKVCTSASGCGAHFEHYQTGKNYKVEGEYPSKRYGRKVKSSGKWMDVDEYLRKAKEGLASLDTNIEGLARLDKNDEGQPFM